MRAPVILTLQVDAVADTLFQDLRARHFPPALNRVGAHLTLFHNLPGTEEDAILKNVAAVAVSTPPFPIEVAGPMRLGRGVALRIESEALVALRRRLAAIFPFRLMGADLEAFRPHVTIQNKVAPEQAGALFDHLAATFTPFDAIAEGMQLWRYHGGPWAPIAAVPLQGAQP